MEHGLNAITNHSAKSVSDTTHTQLHTKIQLLTAKFSKVFKPGLEHCTKVKIPLLHLCENAKLHFSKARKIAFRRRDDVKTELDRIESEKVIVKIDFSDWAAPIVCARKPNNKVRICGDFKALKATTL